MSSQHSKNLDPGPLLLWVDGKPERGRRRKCVTRPLPEVMAKKLEGLLVPNLNILIWKVLELKLKQIKYSTITDICAIVRF